MSEFDPESIDEVLALLPSGCQGCSFATRTIIMLSAFESSTGGPMGLIRHIGENCEGYQGEAEDAPPVEVIDVDGEQGLLFADAPADDENCPFSNRLEEL